MTLWDYVRYGANDFIGEVVIDLAHHILDDEAEWYHLQPHQDTSYLVCVGRVLFQFVRLVSILRSLVRFPLIPACSKNYSLIGVGKTLKAKAKGNTNEFRLSSANNVLTSEKINTELANEKWKMLWFTFLFNYHL